MFCTATFIFVLIFIFLYWDKYCCTAVCMSFTVLKNIVAQPMNMFVPRWNFCFCTERFIFGAVVCVLGIGDIFPYWSLYFCTEINISVLGYTLLYWCIFYCTGKYTRTANEYVCVLRYRMQ